MTTVICVATAILAQAQEKEALPVRLELAAYKVNVLDPLFARVTTTNTKDYRVPLPHDLFLTTGYTFTREIDPYRYTYRFTSEHVSGSQGFVSLDPGQSITLDYEILECPPGDQLEHKFWREVAQPAQSHIAAHLFYFPKNRPPVPIDLTARSQIDILERGADEMKFLTELYAESVRRHEEHGPADGWEALGSRPSDFGLASFHPYPDLVQKLVAYEERLSPGSLRDIVHLVRLTQTIYHSRIESDRRGTVEELLRWLDTLPEIERHCLALRIISWASYNRRADDPAVDLLVYETVQRLPQRLYEFEDYRAYRLQDYASNHPGFRAYLKQREPPDSKE